MTRSLNAAVGRRSRRRSTRLAAVVAGLALVAGGMAACAPAASDSAPAADEPTGPTGTLSIALATPPVTLDPSLNSQGTTATYQVPAYSSLLRLEGVGATQAPGLAESFEWLDDRNTQFEVVLRPDLMFSDGTPLNSEAVKISSEHFAANGGPQSRAGLQIESIDTPDDLTVVYNLVAPNPTFPYELAETTGLGLIVSPQAIADGANLGVATAGAGPYQLDESETVIDSAYVYTPNPHYPDESEIEFEKIVIRVISDPNTALSSLQSGQVQFAYGTPDGLARAEQANLSLASFPAASLALFFLDDGQVVPALADARVRQAMNYAIDRAGITNAVAAQTGVPTAQLPVEGSIGYDPSLNDAYPYDVERAKDLMADAGYADGITVPVLVPSFYSAANNLAQILAEQLREIGVELDLVLASTIGDYVALSRSEDLGGSVFPMPFPLGVPSVGTLMFAPAATGNPRGVDWPIMAEITEANALQGAEADEAWTRINETIVDEARSVPVMRDSFLYFSSPEITGLEYSSAMNLINFQWAK